MQIACANCGKTMELLGEPGQSTQCGCGNKITVPDRPPKQQFGVANCTNCWKRYGVVGRPPGTRFKCKACGEVITIREPGKSSPQQAPVGGAPMPRATPLPDAGPAEEAIEVEEAEEAEEAELVEANEEAKPASPSRRLSARNKGAAEMLELRSNLKKQKGIAETSVAEAREARGKLEEKTRALEGKEAELTRMQDELRGLQDRARRQSDEIASLQGDVIAKTEEAATLSDRVEELDGEARELEEQIASRDGRIKELEDELALRPTREETDAFVAEKADVEKRLTEGGMKISALQDAAAAIRGPMAEALSRIEELSSEAGALDLPDFAAKLGEVRGEADAAKAESKRLAVQLELATKELASAKRKHEDVLRTAEEELEKLSASEGSEERKGFLGGLFRKKTPSDSSAKLRAVASKLKLRSAGATDAGDEEDADDVEQIGEPELVAEAEDLADSVPEDDIEELDVVEEVAEEAETIEAIEDVEEADEVEEIEEIAEAAEVEEEEEVAVVEEAPPAKPKRPKRKRGAAKTKSARRGRRTRR